MKDGDNEGECRRYPPSVVLITIGSRWSATPVTKDSWCGEWTKK